MQISTSTKFAVFVRAARNALNMSQTELAKLANCSRPTINRIETSDSGISPKLVTLNNIIDVFSDRGVELKFDGDEVVIKFNKSSLCLLQENKSIKR